MKIKYTSPPIENRFFDFSATDVSGTAKFEGYLNGKLFWREECPDPPCHEQMRLPDGLAGSTLLIVGSDEKEAHEVMFFINDDGKGIHQETRVKVLEPDNKIAWT